MHNGCIKTQNGPSSLMSWMMIVMWSLQITFSFPQESGIQISLENLFIHIPYGEVGLGVHDDTIFVHLLNLVEVDDVGAVNAHEVIR